MPFFSFFRKLSWKLTVSYTLVTVSALVAVELIVLGIILASLSVFASQAPRFVAREIVDNVAPQLAPFMQESRPNLRAIDSWLHEARRSGISTPREGPAAVTLNATDLADENTQILIVDKERQVLGSIHQQGPPGSAKPLDMRRVPGLEEVLPRALAGVEDANRLFVRTSSGRVTLAVPIRDSNGGPVLGAMVMSGQFDPVAAALRGFAVVIGVSVVVFTVAAGLIGTLFGFFTARGLTRRLSRVATAAAAWGEGDFTPAIHDSSADEIGQLGRRLNRMAAQLEELIQTRQQLSIADERNRLARDLHDSVKQQVFAISMNLGAVQALWEQDLAAARSRLDAAFELARQSQQELTTIIQTLRPVQLEGKGLRQALDEYIHRWQEQSRIAASYGVAGEATLPLDVEETLFRVAQEALANVARHSSASAVRVALTVRPDEAQLEVRDSGQGFDSSKQAGGLGLHSMRERAEAAGGNLTIQSGADGTALTVRIPIEKAGKI